MKLFEYISKLLCPPSCCCCKEVLSINDTSAFCNSCYEALKHRVRDVSKNLNQPSIDVFYYYFTYKNWYVKNILSHSKYICSESFLKFIGKCGKESLDKHNLLHQLDIITFAPRRPGEVRLYGFDQSEEMAKAISKQTGIPCIALLKRKGFSVAQKKLKSNLRSKNVVGKFECTENVKGKRVLLIDDVVTTGSTVGECAKMLKENGAKAVYVWSLAQ